MEGTYVSILRGITTVKQDLAEIESCVKSASGPNKYVIRAVGAQIKATYRLEECIGKNIVEAKKITKAVQDFEKSTNKTEKVMLILAGSQVFLAIVQILSR